MTVPMTAASTPVTEAAVRAILARVPDPELPVVSVVDLGMVHEVTVTDARSDKPVTTLATRITNQDGVVVLDGTAVVWRDPVVAARVP